MSTRKPSGAARRPRRLHARQIALTVIGLLVIATFVLGLLAQP
jgi:hypothetical protein